MSRLLPGLPRARPSSLARKASPPTERAQNCHCALVSPMRLCAHVHPTHVCLCVQIPHLGEPCVAVCVHTPRRCTCVHRPCALVSPAWLCVYTPRRCACVHRPCALVSPAWLSVCAHPTQVYLCVLTPCPGEPCWAVCVCIHPTQVCLCVQTLHSALPERRQEHGLPVLLLQRHCLSLCGREAPRVREPKSGERLCALSCHQ